MNKSIPRAGSRRRGRITPYSMIDVLAIQDLKARYAWFADHKYNPVSRRRRSQAQIDRAAHGQADCFTQDAVWDGGKHFGQRLTGKSALFDFFRGGPWRFALHFYLAPIIEIDGDKARGWWRLWQVAMPRDEENALCFAAVTAETYRREGAEWLHSAVSFEQMHFIRPAGNALALMDRLAT